MGRQGSTDEAVDWVTPQGAADLCEVSLSTIQRWIEKGRIKPGRVGTRYRIPLAELPKVADPRVLPKLARALDDAGIRWKTAGGAK